MKKCKLCGKELRDSYRGNVCRECKGKVGSFAKKSAAGVLAAAGTVAALKAKGVTAGDIAEAGKKVPVVEGLRAAKKAGERIIDRADDFIDEHSLGAKELLDKGLDAAEYRMKGLPASFAKADKLGLGEKLKGIKGKMKYIDDFDEEYEETADQIADINRR